MKRFRNLVNHCACPDFDRSQVLICKKMTLFKAAKIRDESDICIASCLRNFVRSASASDSVTSAGVRVEQVLLEVHEVLHEWCHARPDRVHLICPPMYHISPLWYQDGLSEIMSKFSSIMATNRPSNLLLMPSFPTPSFEADGMHLTASSGLEYLFFLFDSAKDVIVASGTETEVKVSTGSEATRVLDDRVMGLEQDHLRLNQSFEIFYAVNAEQDDFQENVRNKAFFMVSGLPRIKDLRGKEWMTQALSDVQWMIRTLLGSSTMSSTMPQAGSPTPR